MKKVKRAKLRLSIAMLILVLAALACASQDSGPTSTPLPTIRPDTDGPPRPFLLGFTPFPFDLNEEAQEWVYAHIAVDADIVAHHFDGGVPWPEALAGDNYDPHLLAEWEYRRNHTPEGHKVYVAITPISNTRDNLALYRGDSDNMPLPAPWDEYGFDHPDVKTAYLNYAIEVVDFFEPDFLAIGIECNLLAAKSDELWPGYLELHQEVYAQLKAMYPDLPIFVSLLGTALLDGYQWEVDHAQQMRVLEDILPYTDYFGISIYPYLTTYLAEEIPETMWQDLFSLSDKPIALAETGYVADVFELAGTVQVNGTPEKQEAYIQRLLQEAQEREFVFVINFLLHDIDPLLEVLPEELSEIALPWRDSGLYDENGQPRPALRTWHMALARPYQPSE